MQPSGPVVVVVVSAVREKKDFIFGKEKNLN